ARFGGDQPFALEGFAERSHRRGEWVAGLRSDVLDRIAAPAGIPRLIAERLHSEVLRAISVPEVRARLESFGAEVRGSTTAETRALLERNIALWAKVGKDAKIELE